VLITSLILIRLLPVGYRLLWVALLLVVPLRGKVLLCGIILWLRLAHEGLGHRWDLLSDEGRIRLSKV
jgi:hypothetical protein